MRRSPTATTLHGLDVGDRLEVEEHQNLAPLHSRLAVAERFIQPSRRYVVGMDSKPDALCASLSRRLVECQHHRSAVALAMLVGRYGNSQAWHLVALVPPAQKAVGVLGPKR